MQVRCPLLYRMTSQFLIMVVLDTTIFFWGRANKKMLASGASMMRKVNATRD